MLNPNRIKTHGGKNMVQTQLSKAHPKVPQAPFPNPLYNPADHWCPSQCEGIACPHKYTNEEPDITTLFSYGLDVRKPNDVGLLSNQDVRIGINFGFLNDLTFSSLIEEIRSCKDMEVQKRLKLGLPWFCGTLFMRYRDKEHVVNTNYITLDYDGKDFISDEMFAELSERAAEVLDPSLILMFRSPSYRGIKFSYKMGDFVRFDSDFEHAWNYLAEELLEKLGMEADPSGKNRAQVCFFSHDPLLYTNRNCIPLMWKSLPDSSITTKSNKVSAIRSIPNIYCYSDYLRNLETARDIIGYLLTMPCIAYNDWITVGLALKASMGDAGRSLFLKFSDHPSYKDTSEALEYKWKSFDSVRSIGFGSLIHVARNYGWQQ